MKSLLTIAAIALASLPADAIDFTPNYADTVDDGIPMRRMFFADGARRIYYRPPANWTRTGNAETATFSPNGSKSVVMIQNGLSQHASIPFDEPGLEALRKIALAAVPPAATEVNEIWEIMNPVVLQGWTSYEVGFDYILSGNRFCRSILFINLDPQKQVHFIVDAVPAEFAALYKTAYRTLATWWYSTGATAQ